MSLFLVWKRDGAIGFVASCLASSTSTFLIQDKVVGGRFMLYRNVCIEVMQEGTFIDYISSYYNASCSYISVTCNKIVNVIEVFLQLFYVVLLVSVSII